MVSFLLQENIDELQHLADHLLHIGDKNGYVYADNLSALQQSIHEKINDLYSQRGYIISEIFIPASTGFSSSKN